ILASHDMEAVRTLCTEALWIDGGRVRARGCPRETTAAYVRHLFGAGAERPIGCRTAVPRAAPDAAVPDAAATDADAAATPAALPALEDRPGLGRWGSGQGRIVGFRLATTGSDAGDDPTLHHGDRLRLELEYEALDDLGGDRLGVAFSLRNKNGLDLITFATWEVGGRLPPLPRGGRLRLAFDFDNILPRGEYGLVLALEEVLDEGRRYLDFIEHATLVRVSSS